MRTSPKKDAREPGSSRTARARRFVLERVRERPGHRVTARGVYRAYMGWARHHEPEAPLSYGAFVGVLESWAPIEDRCTVRNARGRPALAFVGITTGAAR